MPNVSTFGNTADIYTIVHLVPHASYGVKSGDRGGPRISASSSRPVRPILNAIFATTVS